MLLSLVCLTAQILKVSFHIHGDTPIQKKEHMEYLPQEYRFEFLSLRKTYPKMHVHNAGSMCFFFTFLLYYFA